MLGLIKREREKAMFCAISGVAAQTPVVSSATGLIYEKRLIVKALEASASGGALLPHVGR